MPHLSLYSHLGVPSTSSPTPTTFDAPHFPYTSITLTNSSRLCEDASCHLYPRHLADDIDMEVHLGRRYVVDFVYLVPLLSFLPPSEVGDRWVGNSFPNDFT